MSTKFQGTAVRVCGGSTFVHGSIRHCTNFYPALGICHLLCRPMLALFIDKGEQPYSLLLKVGHDRQHSRRITLVRRQPAEVIDFNSRKMA